MKIELLTLTVRVAALIVTAFVIPALKTWLEKKTENENLAQVQEWAAKAVQAAEQIHKKARKDDPTGVKRRKFAIDFLNQLCAKHGVRLSKEEIEVLIEAAVDEVNNCRLGVLYSEETTSPIRN